MHSNDFNSSIPNFKMIYDKMLIVDGIKGYAFPKHLKSVMVYSNEVFDEF